MKIADIELTVWIIVEMVEGKKVRKIISAREAKAFNKGLKADDPDRAVEIKKTMKYNRPEKLGDFVSLAGYSDERAASCLADHRLYHGVQSQMRQDILNDQVKEVYDLSFPTGERAATKAKAEKVVEDYFRGLARKKLDQMPPEGRKAFEKALFDRNVDVEAPEDEADLAVFFFSAEIKKRMEDLEVE